MTYKVSYPQMWHPTEGTHYTQQLRIRASRDEMERAGLHLRPGINYTHVDGFIHSVIRLGINRDPRILCGRNSVIKFEPTN